MQPKHIDSRESGGRPARPRLNKKQEKKILSDEEKDKRATEVTNTKRDTPVFFRDDLKVSRHKIAAKITIDKETHYVVLNSNSKRLASDGVSCMVHLIDSEYKDIVNEKPTTIHNATIKVNHIDPASVAEWKKRKPTFMTKTDANEKLQPNQYRIERMISSTLIYCNENVIKKIEAELPSQRESRKRFISQPYGLIIHIVLTDKELAKIIKTINKIEIFDKYRGEVINPKHTTRKLKRA